MGNTTSVQRSENCAIVSLDHRMELTEASKTEYAPVGIFGEPLLAKPPNKSASLTSKAPAASERGDDGQGDKSRQERTPPLALFNAVREIVDAAPILKPKSDELLVRDPHCYDKSAKTGEEGCHGSSEQDLCVPGTRDVLPIAKAKTYADATNLAAQFPELAPTILEAPLAISIPNPRLSSAPSFSGAPTIDKNGHRHRQLQKHTYEQPNWALAASDNVSKHHQKPRPSMPFDKSNQNPSRGGPERRGPKSRHAFGAENRPNTHDSIQPRGRTLRGENHSPTPPSRHENAKGLHTRPRQPGTTKSKNPNPGWMHSSQSQTPRLNKLGEKPLLSATEAKPVVASDCTRNQATPSGACIDTALAASSVEGDVNLMALLREDPKVPCVDARIACDDPVADQDVPATANIANPKDVHQIEVGRNMKAIEDIARRLSFAEVDVDGKASKVEQEPTSSPDYITGGGATVLTSVSTSSLTSFILDEMPQIPMTATAPKSSFDKDTPSFTMDSDSSAEDVSMPSARKCMGTPVAEPSRKTHPAISVSDPTFVQLAAAEPRSMSISVPATYYSRDARELAAEYARKKATRNLRRGLDPQQYVEELVPDVEGSGGPGGLSGGVALGMRLESGGRGGGYRRAGMAVAYSRPSAHVVYAPEGEAGQGRRRRRDARSVGGHRLNVGGLGSGGEDWTAVGGEYGGRGWCLGEVVVEPLPMGLGLIYYEYSGMPE
ncbi:hypothetical protein OF83DRAFT_1096616 [Amylostereum chailletii]|nr:hypothetical protein OF83DRAFT_1096616 [Amylostereum chailletii]